MLVPSSSFTYSAVRVATPLIRCIMLSIKRSVCKSDCIFPSTTNATSPTLTLSPSCKNCVIFNSESNVAKMRFATSTPAKIPFSLIISCDFPIAVSGMQESVVWSPSPISSANQSFMSSSKLSIIAKKLFFVAKLLKSRDIFLKTITVLILKNYSFYYFCVKSF